jgi:hypothetical protein
VEDVVSANVADMLEVGVDGFGHADTGEQEQCG